MSNTSGDNIPGAQSMSIWHYCRQCGGINGTHMGGCMYAGTALPQPTVFRFTGPSGLECPNPNHAKLEVDSAGSLRLTADVAIAPERAAQAAEVLRLLRELMAP